MFCGTHPTPGLGTLGANLVVSQIDVCDGCIDPQRLSQGLEAATDQESRVQFTLNGIQNLSDLRLANTLQKSKEILHFHPASMFDTLLDQR